MEGEWVIEVQGLAHTYTQGSRNVTALCGVDLRIRRKEIVALLGPNGAGKTTLLSAIEGLLKPTRGSVRVAEDQQVQRHIGIHHYRACGLARRGLGGQAQFDLHGAPLPGSWAADGFAGRSRTAPLIMSKRNIRHSMGPFHSGTRREPSGEKLLPGSGRA